MNKFLRERPLETYLFFVGPFFVFTYAGLFQSSFFSDLDKNFFSVINSYAALGITTFGLALLAVGVYLLIKFVVLFTNTLASKQLVQWKDNSKKLLFFTLSSFYLVMMLFLVGAIITSSVQFVNTPDPRNVFYFSEKLMNWDIDIFGSPIVFTIQALRKYELLDKVIVLSYKHLPLVLSLAFLALLAFDQRLFRQFIVSFTYVVVLSVPFWIVIPAISPDEMYRSNILSIPAESLGLLGESQEISPEVEKYAVSLQVARVWSKPNESYFAVTSFPSMHVAWGLIIMVYLGILWRPSLILIMPWFVVNTFSAIYTLQHYAVDLPAGIIFGGIIIFITNKLFGWDKAKYGNSELYVFSVIDEDVKRLKKRHGKDESISHGVV